MHASGPVDDHDILSFETYELFTSTKAAEAAQEQPIPQEQQEVL